MKQAPSGKLVAEADFILFWFIFPFIGLVLLFTALTKWPYQLIHRSKSLSVDREMLLAQFDDNIF